MNMLDPIFIMAEQTREKVYLAVDPLLVRDSLDLREKIGELGAYALFYDTRLNAYMDKSPYLAEVAPNSALTHIFNRVDMRSKAVFISSPLKLHKLAEYLQKFMFKTRYDDELLLLRIYDPYVIHDFEILFPDRGEQVDFFSEISTLLYTASDRRRYIRTIDGVRHE